MAPELASSTQSQASYALTLGWVIGELFAGTFPKDPGEPRTVPQAESHAPTEPRQSVDSGPREAKQKAKVELSGLGDLPAGVLFNTRVAWGAGLATKTGIGAVSTAWTTNVGGVEASETKAAGQPAVKVLHEALLAAFLSESLELAHTYDLGRSLRGTVTAPTTAAEVEDIFREGRIDTICERLDDIACALPLHAAASVAGSLRNWADAATNPELLIAAAKENATRQGTLWLSVLIGEKAPTSALDGRAYLLAARRVVAQLWANTGDMLRVFGAPLALVAGALGLLAWAVFGSGSWQSVLGALGTVAAAFGITRQAAKAQETSFLRSIVGAMWTEEVQAAAAQAITLLPK